MSILNINLSNIQETLVSGTNIKTINGESLLGSGNIVISGGSSISFGSSGQIPVMNALGNDFDYSSGLTYSGTELYSEGNLKLKLVGQSGKDFQINPYGTNDHAITGGNVLHLQYLQVTASYDAFMAYSSSTRGLNVGTSSSMGAKLGVKGGGSGSGTTTFLLRNASDTDLVKTTDNGLTFFSAASGFDVIRFKSQYTQSGYLGSDNNAIWFATSPSAGGGAMVLKPANINFTFSGSSKLFVNSLGNVGIGTSSPTSKLQVVGLSTYADNAAAITAGLTAGAMYIRSGHGLDIVT